MINRDRVVKRFLEYVQIDSESYKEGAFAKRLAKDLEKLGLEVEFDKACEVVKSDTGNLIAKLKGNVEGEPILFACHMDTVTPCTNIKPIIKDDIIYSDGTTVLGGDDKGGIAAIIEALTVIKENNIKHPNIEIVFTVAEEVGIYGAKNLDYSKIESKNAFIFDTSGDIGTIVIKGPAQDKLLVKITGKSAHAGVSPEDGISAIQIASEAISNMKLLRIDENTTANIGKINGGVATNIVCPEVIIEAETRSTVIESLEKQTAHMIETFEKAAEKFGGKVEITVNRLFGQFVINEDDEIVIKAKNALKAIGIEGKTKSTGGGSDTNVFNGNGLKAVNLSSGERKPHTLEEHMKIEDLEILSRLIVELSKA
ncbi:M20/M25/M40 family metallo-hydrolase [Clostridium septicum]|uniref:M20/M25/M40 family metallo-hydrolase n=1 Tax=Clostridium septicum TaxID=1504 RepID=A0A9N7PM61_CLOSE|nr:M20/M25/M40 family metallo-hydrolase [Clostridium septicum]AYE35461.1 peptidase M20 [Clostridium septicum]MDU1314116.1 M20/M25/M40 family metallo-hydrolase [Clostridium septicum]QAS60849.1 M20/M25/M40 family metallo-hydrolase [Clostridium septicum]UEC19883.1 M20/M25/M40 family metallo-hydrolase [Clostridium septicum]USS02057.1 M20/M25/M40 family metallo-hydrolase [Clostridium septicum]